MIKLMIKLIAIVCNKIYGYEALNLLFRILPSQLIVMVLRGNDCYIGRECIFDLMDKIIIRDRVTISHKCLFNTHTHAGKSNLLVEGILPLSQNTININDDTYIGSGVTILEGVTIGIGAIVGAMSLVNKDVPSKATVVGIPSKVTRQR